VKIAARRYLMASDRSQRLAAAALSPYYFSMITTVGTPQTVTAEELRLECMFPADDATEAEHTRFIAANSPARSAHH
jgi:hypothetical protein